MDAFHEGNLTEFNRLRGVYSQWQDTEIIVTLPSGERYLMTGSGGLIWQRPSWRITTSSLMVNEGSIFSYPAGSGGYGKGSWEVPET